MRKRVVRIVAFGSLVLGLGTLAPTAPALAGGSMGYPPGFPPANLLPGQCVFRVNSVTGVIYVAHGTGGAPKVERINNRTIVTDNGVGTAPGNVPNGDSRQATHGLPDYLGQCEDLGVYTPP